MYEIPVLPKLESIVVNTENLLAWNRMKHHSASGVHEIEHEITNSLSKWLHKFDEVRRSNLQFLTELEIPDGADEEQNQESENYGSNQDVTHACQCDQPADCNSLFVVKLVITDKRSSESVQQALYQLMSLLKRDKFDLVLLAVRHSSRIELTPESFYEAWRGVESLIAEDRVRAGGICDLVAPDHIYNFCHSVSIKPAVVQISREFLTANALPKALADCAESLQIRISTHNDSCDPLPDELLRNLLKRLCTAADGELWHVEWLVRYSRVNPGSGTICSLGYCFNAKRDTKQLVQLL